MRVYPEIHWNETDNLFCPFASFGQSFLTMPRFVTRMIMQNKIRWPIGPRSMWTTIHLSKEAAVPLIRAWLLCPYAANLAYFLWPQHAFEISTPGYWLTKFPHLYPGGMGTGPKHIVHKLGQRRRQKGKRGIQKKPNFNYIIILCRPGIVPGLGQEAKQ